MRLSETSASTPSQGILSEPGPSITRLKANGHATNGATNGFSSLSPSPSPPTNGVAQRLPVQKITLPGSALYDDSTIDREEFVRLVIQTLRDVGYRQSAATLEEESGYPMETGPVSSFREKVLEGAWQEAEGSLAELGLTEEIGLIEAKSLILQQKYLELLEARRTTEALRVLRNQLAPLHSDPSHLHFLSSLLMCTDATDLRERAAWDGAEGSSRRRLLIDLQHWIPSSIMIPPRRFSALLDQALRYQSSQCLWHNTPPHSLSLYSDHRCEDDAFPRHNTFNLVSHEDEVWSLEWSHSGRRLATASKDKSAIIWSVEHGTEVTVEPELHLTDHPFAVGCVAWSYDDSTLLTASDHIIKMWDTKNGHCLRSIETAHTETVSALAWVPDGSGFVSGSQDRKIVLWGADGKQRDSWGLTPIRITDLAISADYTRLVAIGECAPGLPGRANSTTSREDSATPPAASRRASTGLPAHAPRVGQYEMIVYDPRSKQVDFVVPLEGQLTSVKISADSRYALVNNAPDEIHLWDLWTQRMVRKYIGQRQGQHVIRSCFGGIDENFVVSGSEDGRIYVWHRVRGVMLIVLEGHGLGSVNSVAWNPRNVQMFASCSDDYTVRIWQAIPAAKLVLGPASESLEAEDEASNKGKGKRREPWDGQSSSSF